MSVSANTLTINTWWHVVLKWWCQELQRWRHCRSLPSASSCVSWCLEGVPQCLHEWRLVSAPSPPLQETQYDKTSYSLQCTISLCNCKLSQLCNLFLQNTIIRSQFTTQCTWVQSCCHVTLNERILYSNCRCINLLHPPHYTRIFHSWSCPTQREHSKMLRVSP